MKKIVVGLLEENCYIIDNNLDCVVIDPGGDYDKIKKEIGNLNIKYVLLTHGHLDHIDCIDKFDCPIYVHELDYEKLYDDILAGYYHMDMKRGYDPKKVNVIKIKDNDSIPFNDFEFRVIHTPGHTNGSVCYLYKDKLFSGDTLFKESIGRYDLPTGNYKDIKHSIVKLIDMLDDRIKVYPGHGDNTTIHDERKNNEFYKYYKRQGF